MPSCGTQFEQRQARQGCAEARVCREPRKVNIVKLHISFAVETHVLHNTNGLLGLGDELVFGLLNFFLGLGAQLLLLVCLVVLRVTAKAESSTLGVGLDGIQRQTRVLDVLAGAGSERQVGVESGVPTGKETALDLGILGKTGFTNTLAGKRILLQSRRKRIFASTSVVLVEKLAAGQTGAGNSMAESLGLRLGGGRSDEGGLGFGRRSGRREKADLFADGATKVLESLLDVRGVVVGLVGVLRAIKPCQNPTSEPAVTQLGIMYTHVTASIF